MTKKDFELIAHTLWMTRPPTTQSVSRAQWERTAVQFGASLPATNPNFNRDRFFRACGVEE